METNPSNSERKASWRGRLHAAAAIVIVTFILLEVVLRAFGLTNPILYERDEAAGFRLKPNQHVRYIGNSIVINQWGVRDPRPLDTKAEGVRRIVVLGDSVTWGGIRERQENLFTSVLERALPNVEVVNAGVNGYSVARMAALYQAHLKNLQPGIIVVYAIAADFTRPVRLELTGGGAAFPEKPPRLAVMAAVRLAQVLVHARLGWAWLEPPAPAVVPEDALGDDAENLRRNTDSLIALADTLEPAVRLLVVFAPTLRDEESARVIPVVTQALDAHSITWKKLDSLVTPSPDLFVDGVHLSTEGHRRVGEALAGYLGFLSAGE